MPSMKREQTIAERIAEESNAIDADRDAPVTNKVTVTRGHGRSRVLQIRLNEDELAELERLAASRGLPPSTLAREAILRLLYPDTARTADADRLVQDFARFITEYASHGPASKTKSAVVRKAKFASGKVQAGRGKGVRS